MTDDLAALVADIKGKAEEATPGPWQSEWPMGDDGLDETGPRYIVAPAITVDPDTAVATLRPEQQEDAAFIAAVNPANVLRLISALETAERERDEAVKRKDWLKDATRRALLSAASAQDEVEKFERDLSDHLDNYDKLVSERDALRADVGKLREALAWTQANSGGEIRRRAAAGLAETDHG